MTGISTIILAYLLGSIPFGYLIVRWQKGVDVRATGSGSIGATNVMRNLGPAGFLATFGLDCGKGVAAVLLGMRWTENDPSWVGAAAVAAILGHCFPFWLKFRGGKGVATAIGAYILLTPAAVGAWLAIFAVMVVLWRYVSLGSITASALFPALVYFLNQPPGAIVLSSVASAAIVIGKHHSNIRRLLKGMENKIGRRAAASDK
jgi:glycerol-3-phosphate acyltransferase PlsY